MHGIRRPLVSRSNRWTLLARHEIVEEHIDEGAIGSWRRGVGYWFYQKEQLSLSIEHGDS